MTERVRLQQPEVAEIKQLEDELQEKLQGRVHDLRLTLRGPGVVLRGLAYTFHGKQLAQHAVINGTDLPLVANEIQVI